MNAGFWLSAAVLAGGAATAAWLLPASSRADQVRRDEIGSVGDTEHDGDLGDDGDFDHIDEDVDREFALSAMVGGVR
jgi:hypothetical protein